MAVSVEELRATLRMEMKPFIRDLQQMNGISAKSAKLMESTWLSTSKKIDGFGKNMAKSLITPMAGLGAALGARELAQLADTWSDLTSRVNLATGSHAKGAEVMGRLGEMARMTYSSLELTTESYLGNSTAIKELGYSTDQTLDYTEALNNALVVSGAKGDRAKSVIEALSKAMALGKLSGDNLNTVISTGGRAAEALAAGLGTTVGGLRTLGAQGRITGRDIVTALTSQMATLRKEAESMPATIGDGFQLLSNAMLQYVGNADTATGVSAKVAEALIIIADNFDKVADSGLQVAAVIAGALVGRSLVQMIAKLGLAGVELKKFLNLLSAARTMGGMATAMTGLSAAAGPLGLIIGGAVVGSLVHYGLAATDASEKSKRLQAEFENMGLLARRSANDVDQATASLDELSKGEKARKLREINDELDRLRNGNRFANDGEDVAKNINAIIYQVNNLKGFWAEWISSSQQKTDNKALEDIKALAVALQASSMPATDILAKLKTINETPVSQYVVDLGNELKRTVEITGAATAAMVGLGEMPGLAEAKQGVVDLRDQLGNLAEQGHITEAQQKQLQELADKLVTTEDGADDARKSLAKIGAELPNIAGFLSTMDSAIAKLGEVIARSKEAQTALNMAYPLGPDENKQARSSLDPYIQERKAGNAYEQDALRKAKLGKDQLALENKIASVREKSIKDGQKLTEEQIRRIAHAELAGEKTRSSEGKKPKAERHKKTGDDYFSAQIQQVKDRTAALAEEAKITGLTYQEQERRLMALDLEQSVLERLREEARQKGVKDLDSIKLSSSQVEAINAVSAAYAQQADELRKVQEAQADAENAAQQFYDTFKSGMVGAITGATSLQDALSGILNKLAEMILNRAFDTIFGGASSSRTGGWLTGVMKTIGFADGGFTGSGGVNQPAGVVHKGEVVWSQRDVRRAGGVATVEAMRRGFSGYLNGGAVSVLTPQIPALPNLRTMNGTKSTISTPISITIDATGADAAGLAKVERQLAKLKAEIPARVIQTVRKAQKSNVSL